MKSRYAFLSILFLLIAVGQLTGSWLDSAWMEYVFKPLIIPMILLMLWLGSSAEVPKGYVSLALIFCWIGDILLMFSDRNELFFFGGVGSFLLGQVFYIFTFLQDTRHRVGYLKKRPFWYLPFAGYLILLIILLLPGLEGIMLPVVIFYGITLVGMSAAAFNRYQTTSLLSFRLVYIGSLLFVASDSLLAWSKFLDPIPRGGFLVMLTYIGAQYLIMKGFTKTKD